MVPQPAPDVLRRPENRTLNDALLVWGLKDPAVLESWDERITVAEAIPMFRDARKMMNGFTRLFAAISDRLKLQYVVRLEMRGR